MIICKIYYCSFHSSDGLVPPGSPRADAGRRAVPHTHRAAHPGGGRQTARRLVDPRNIVLVLIAYNQPLF